MNNSKHRADAGSSQMGEPDQQQQQQMMDSPERRAMQQEFSQKMQEIEMLKQTLTSVVQENQYLSQELMDGQMMQ